MLQRNVPYVNFRRSQYDEYFYHSRETDREEKIRRERRKERGRTKRGRRKVEENRQRGKEDRKKGKKGRIRSIVLLCRRGYLCVARTALAGMPPYM